jgi:hypothetical protein
LALGLAGIIAQFVSGWVPVMFVPGQGLTITNSQQYVIIFYSWLSGVLSLLQRKWLSINNAKLMVLSIFFTILAGRSSMSGLRNYHSSGTCFGLFSFWLALYRVLVGSSLLEPVQVSLQVASI